MNILGEGFPNEIIKQIENRQTFYGAGFANGIERSNNVLKYLNSNTSWVKLVSSTNITNQDIIQNETLRNLKNIQGNSLAKKFVLFNGTDNEGHNRAGIDYENNILSNNAYGIGGNEFGIQPMMGIKSANIKHLNNGSLRKATVQIKAFNRTQFDIIDILYLRLGFSILLEWGHSMYIDDKGDLQSNNNTSLAEYFLSGKKYKTKDDSNQTPEPLTYKTFLGYIDDRRKKSCGNYDAMFARVVNFHWSFLPDGSYDITLDLISVGDVVDSFKINTLNPTVSTSSPTTNVNNIKLEEIDEKIDLYANKSTIGQYLYKMKKSMFIVVDAATKFSYNSNQKNSIDRTNEINIAKSFSFSSLSPQITGLVDGVKHAFLNKEPQYYCRLGNFLEFIEKYVMYQVGTNNVNIPLLNFDTDIESNLMYIDPMQVSVDPTICMVNKILTIKGTPSHFFPYGETFLNSNIQSPTNAEYGQIMNIYINFKFILNKLDENKNIETGAVALIDFLQSILSGINGALGGLNKLDVFIDEVTNTVKIIDKNPLPDSEYVINYFNGKEKYKVYNKYALFNLYGYEKKEGENTKAGFIKDFSFKTEITPQMATMISVAAAANNTTVGENTTALSRLNSGLMDRFKESMSTTESTLQSDIVKKYQDIYSQIAIQYDVTYSKLIEYLRRIENNKWTLEETNIYKDSLVNVLKYKQQYSKARADLDAVKSGKSQEEINKILLSLNNFLSPSTGFIPFNLSVTMDGLSGMKVNSKFYIDSSYLPSNYPNTVEFLIKNEAHTIENNKWFTTLESYCISKGNFSEIKDQDIDPQGQKPTQQPSPPPLLTNGFPKYVVDNSVLNLKKFVYPTSGVIVSKIAVRAIQNNVAGSDQHRAMDIAAPKGTPIYSSTDGIVRRIGASGYGPNAVYIEVDKSFYITSYTPQKYYIIYGHMDISTVKIGDQVKAGQLIGTVGDKDSPGRFHLHFQIRNILQGFDSSGLSININENFPLKGGNIVAKQNFIA